MSYLKYCLRVSPKDLPLRHTILTILKITNREETVDRRLITIPHTSPIRHLHRPDHSQRQDLPHDQFISHNLSERQLPRHIILPPIQQQLNRSLHLDPSHIQRHPNTRALMLTLILIQTHMIPIQPLTPGILLILDIIPHQPVATQHQALIQRQVPIQLQAPATLHPPLVIPLLHTLDRYLAQVINRPLRALHLRVPLCPPIDHCKQ
jgi:hypothetical protein